MDLLLQIFVYAVVSILLTGIALPLLLPLLQGLAEAFSRACEFYARFEDWRSHRHASPR